MNNNKIFWNTIKKSIVAMTLSVAIGVTSVIASVNGLVKLLERKKETASICATGELISNNILNLRTTMQETAQTLENNKATIVNTSLNINPNVKTNASIHYISANNNNEINIEQYINAINKIDVNYNLKKYYPTENDTFKIFADEITTVLKCENEFNGDIKIVCDKIIENSKQYVKENPEFITAFKNESIQNQALIKQQQDFETTLYKILDNWKNNSNNVYEDFCTLENYSIVFSFDKENYKSHLAYTTHNAIVIFPERIENEATRFNEDYMDLLYCVINHQLNNVRQRACKCRIYRCQSYYKIPTKTLTDAITESETKYYNNHSMYNLNFYFEKQCEELLLTLGLFKDNVTYNDYYNAIYNSDLTALHNFFNVTTEEDVYKLYTILYTIDAINLKNDLIFKHYDDKTSISQNEIKTFVGHSYKIDIFKNVLKNMIQYTSTHNDFTIEDNLIMFNLIKAFIVKDSYNISSKNNAIAINYDDEFIEKFNNLNSIYYEFLNDKYGITIEKINELENTITVDIIYYIEAYCQENYQIIPQRYYYTTESLVNRFPLLKSMFNTNKYLATEYKEFMHKTK